MDLVESVEHEQDVNGERLLAVLADELGYDDVIVVNMQFARHGSRKFVRPEMARWYALRNKYWFGYMPIVAEDGYALGSSDEVSFADIAEDICKHLKNGEWLAVAGKKFKADDVPRFMIECVLNGIC